MKNEELLDHLLHITDVLAADMDRYLRSLGLTTVKAHVLWTLHSGGPCRQRDLATALGHSPRHVTTLVDELLAAGYVTRQAHPQDRRAVLIDLTPHAAALLEQMADGRTELGEQLFGHLGPDDRRDFGLRLREVEQTLTELTAEEKPDGGRDGQRAM